MRSLFNLFLLIFCFLAVVPTIVAQEEEEMTESSDPIDNYYIDDIVERRLITENRVLPYEPIREADIAWQKRIWRIVDTREKMNLGWQYPEKPFFSILKEHLENGDIKAFADESFKEEMFADDIAGKLNRIDTVTFFDEDTYEEQIKIVENTIDPTQIKRFRIKEIWFFDEEASAMKVRILGICPIIDKFDDNTQEFLYEEPLFWVYYPETREYFAKHRVFNDFNDAAPMTWYDMFEARFFSSYIYKASNALDLRLKDLYPEKGIDRLLESEKIKAELFNFEHDLWEY